MPPNSCDSARNLTAGIAVRPYIQAFNMVGDTSSLCAISAFDMRWRNRSISMFKNICSLRFPFGASADNCIITHKVCIVKQFVRTNVCVARAKKNCISIAKNIAIRVFV